jgi:undecaprenyl-diphosphatase
VTALAIGAALVAGAGDVPARAGDELDVAKAAVLGVVEGVTEYLPVSSTGHLLVAQELMDVGSTDATEDAADTYAITIQSGAIAAVLVLYARRVRAVAAGLVGRDPEGRRVLHALVAAFVPAAVVGVTLESTIKDALFGAGPVVVAWAIGGVVILVEARWLRVRGTGTTPLEAITPRTAFVIGLAQVLALWPGTSRSFVTILAGLALGLSVAAALEFSFLLGLVTLGAATAYEAARNGDVLFEAYGVLEPAVGFVVAFVAAVVAVRWFVTYLARHGLELFGWYRLAAAALTTALVLTDVW